MGLVANIYKSRGASYSNGGLSTSADRVVIVNVDGPFEPREDAPAVLLMQGACRGVVVAVPAVKTLGGYVALRAENALGPMDGGCYVGAADSRFVEAIEAITGGRFDGAVPLHDRFESGQTYDDLSR